LVLSSVFLGDGEEQIDVFVQRLAAREPFSRLVLPVSINETNLWWMLSGKPRFNIKGEFIGYHGVGSDVTESHGFNQRIEYIARHDALTGTLNRSRFNEILAERFEILDDCEVGFCLISFDLDNFKGVNDTFGHAIGDELLQIVAERIIQSVNFGDVVARIGGDEFHVLADCESKEDGMELANRIIREVNRPVVIHDTRITTGASAGLSYAPWDVKDPVQMLKQSDLALYHAKRKGRGLACQYDDMIEFEMQVRAKLEADLQAALAHNQFELLFQPIFSLHTSKIVGVEALIRWQHPTRGRIFPDEFIATAERTGLIEPIGRWVITEACRVAASLPTHIMMSINLSPIQLQNPKLVDLTAKTIQITGLDPARIEFEITESSVLDTEDSSLATFEALSGLGVKFALDDFGTGHSSLSLLHRLKFDRLKIDRSFTAGMLTDAVNRTLVEKTIELSQALDIEVTVEGIETEAQAAFLRKYAGICGQGYLFGRPSRIQDIVFDLAPAEVLRPEKPGARSNIVALERRLRDG
jgi:diguanylate cyclase (GGDEF)-like protein